jgi:polysaccharide pyruvyl transferase WcaK-like protein
MPKTRVGVYGVFGRGNFGNEATLASFLRRLDPERYEAVIICEAPAAAEAIHGVRAVRVGVPVDVGSAAGLRRRAITLTNRMGLLLASIRIARTLDAIVVAGTGGFERLGTGAFGTPIEIWSLGLGARLARRPFILLDIGVEYLPRAIGRYFARGTARFASYRSYRDSPSRDSVRRMGVRSAAKDPVATDLAFFLEPPRTKLRPGSTVSVGVMNYRSRESTREPSPEVREQYAAKCIELVRVLQAGGHAVRLVGGDEEDLVFARGLAETLSDGTPVVDARSATELVAELSASEVVVASRYHTLVMALLAGTPALSIGYSEKHRSILMQLGLPEVHYDIQSFDPAAVAAAVEELASNRPALSARIDVGVEGARRRLDAQWPDVEAALQRGRG